MGRRKDKRRATADPRTTHAATPAPGRRRRWPPIDWLLAAAAALALIACGLAMGYYIALHPRAKDAGRVSWVWLTSAGVNQPGEPQRLEPGEYVACTEPVKSLEATISCSAPPNTLSAGTGVSGRHPKATLLAARSFWAGPEASVRLVAECSPAAGGQPESWQLTWEEYAPEGTLSGSKSWRLGSEPRDLRVTAKTADAGQSLEFRLDGRQEPFKLPAPAALVTFGGATGPGAPAVEVSGLRGTRADLGLAGSGQGQRDKRALLVTALAVLAALGLAGIALWWGNEGRGAAKEAVRALRSLAGEGERREAGFPTSEEIEALHRKVGARISGGSPATVTRPVANQPVGTPAATPRQGPLGLQPRDPSSLPAPLRDTPGQTSSVWSPEAYEQDRGAQRDRLGPTYHPPSGPGVAGPRQMATYSSYGPGYLDREQYRQIEDWTHRLEDLFRRTQANIMSEINALKDEAGRIENTLSQAKQMAEELATAQRLSVSAATAWGRTETLKSHEGRQQWLNWVRDVTSAADEASRCLDWVRQNRVRSLIAHQRWMAEGLADVWGRLERDGVSDDTLRAHFTEIDRYVFGAAEGLSVGSVLPEAEVSELPERASALRQVLVTLETSIQEARRQLQGHLSSFGARIVEIPAGTPVDAIGEEARVSDDWAYPPSPAQELTVVETVYRGVARGTKVLRPAIVRAYRRYGESRPEARPREPQPPPDGDTGPVSGEPQAVAPVSEEPGPPQATATTPPVVPEPPAAGVPSRLPGWARPSSGENRT